MSEANKAVVRRYLQAVVDGDLTTIEALQHPDCSWWVLGTGVIDRDTFTRMVGEGLLSATKRTIDIIGMTAEGDRVAVMLEGRMEFPGALYCNSYHNLLVIRDGLIVEGREYMDTRAAAEAFGT